MMNATELAEPMNGKTMHWMHKIAMQYDCVVTGSLIITEDEKFYNRLIWMNSDGSYNYYDKRHLFTLAKEHHTYTPGKKRLIVELKGWKICPMICYDLRFPELFREVVVQSRPELFVVIANFPEKRIHHWVRLLQARAIENQAYVAGVNRIGADPFASYPGRSLLIDPHGEILADAGQTEGIIRAELDLAALRKYREALPFLADIRSRS